MLAVVMNICYNQGECWLPWRVLVAMVSCGIVNKHVLSFLLQSHLGGVHS